MGNYSHLKIIHKIHEQLTGKAPNQELIQSATLSISHTMG
jgi:hypothetical protein